jgi:beta-glucosidase
MYQNFEMDVNADDFGKDFKWGVSTAAYQIEGAYSADGKGKSIWDVFSNTKGKIANNENGNVSCDFYNLYKSDIELMHQLGITNFRFSISWSRILPCGKGAVNQAGVAFYNKVIDYCLQLGIEPWITLYHWDLPYELEKPGGWTNRDIVGWFSDYVVLCLKSFGDRVKNWMILNEPMVFTGAGYFLGVHAPGRKGLNNFLAAIHHTALCQAEGGRIVRTMLPDARVGTTFSCSNVEPYSNSIRDCMAAFRVDALLNRMFVEPLAGLGYPVQDLKLLQRLEPFIKDGDESKLAFNMDFIGIQNYTREIIAWSAFTPLIWAKVIKAEKRSVETTEMGWEVYPDSMYKMLGKYSKYKSFKELIVTENGAAFHDFVVDGNVKDEKRRKYLEQHIHQVLKAKNAGINVNGYFIWSFTDNFEWAEGFRPRFGLVHVDFETQERIVKESGKWYSRMVKGNFTKKEIEVERM